MKNILNKVKDHFIPHSGNEYSPHFWRHKSIIFLLGLIAVLELGFLVQVFVVFDKTNFLASVLPGVLTSLTNEERENANLPQLAKNNTLEMAAKMKAYDMASKGYFAHNSPDGKTPWYWLREAGYDFKYAGENLAVNFFESADVARAWMNSPTHRANILKKDYQEIGIAVAEGIYEGKSAVFVVQFFGTQNKESLPIVATASTTQPKPPTETLEVIEINPLIESPQEVLDVKENNNSANVSDAEETLAPSQTVVLGETTFSNKALSSPKTFTGYIYFFLSVILIIPLFVALLVRSEKRHPLVLMRGAALLLLIGLLSVFNVSIASGTKIQIGEGGVSFETN